MAEFHDIPDFLDGGVPPERGADRLPAKKTPPTRAQLRASRRRAAAVSVAWFAVQLAAFGVRPDFAELPGSYLAVMIAAPLAAGLLVLMASLHPGRFGLGLRTPLIVALSFLAPAAFIVAALVMPPPAAGVHGLMPGLFCLNAILAWTLLPMVAAALVLRRAFASGAVYRSVMVGGGVGLVAGALFAVHCPITEHLHVALGHGGAVAVAALAGGLLLARVTRI